MYHFIYKFNTTFCQVNLRIGKVRDWAYYEVKYFREGLYSFREVDNNVSKGVTGDDLRTTYWSVWP